LGGEGNTIYKANALAGGKGTTVNGEYTFAWSDGQRNATFSVSNGHTFAVSAKSGVAIATDSPNTAAALTVSGDLRIQHYTSDTNICNTTTIGTTKSVATGNQLCACFCDGKGWQAVLDTPQCVNACKDPRNDLKTICDYTDLWKAGSGGDYKHKFEPAWTGELLTGMIGCESGVVVPQFSYFYKTGTNNGTLNGL
jgi:hypothetical protein